MKKTYRHNKFTATFSDEDGYFSLTGHVNGGSGAVGDKIATVDPRFKLLNAMHLSDAKMGAPVHAEANALYWAQEGKINTLSTHLRVSTEQATKLSKEVLLAQKLGAARGEKHAKDWMARCKTFTSRIKRAVTTTGKTLFDIDQELRRINGELNTNEKVRFPLSPHSSPANLEKYKALAVKMGENVLASAKKTTQFSALQAEVEAKEVVSAHLKPLWDIWKKQAQEALALAAQIPSDLTEEKEGFNPKEEFDEPDKARALAQHLDVDVSVIEKSTYDENLFGATGQDFLVVTDDEADDLWDQDLDNYLEECVYPELPQNTRNYFDDDTWKHDARMDGRGHCLGRYDGCEHFETVGGETYYIYRQ